MWMCYVQEIPVTDLESGVKHLHQKFLNLAFDAHHEANYGLGRFRSPSECEALGDKYDEAADMCSDFLDGTRFIEELINMLVEHKLEGFLYPIRSFLPQHLARQFFEAELEELRYFFDTESEEMSNENENADNDKNVENNENSLI